MSGIGHIGELQVINVFQRRQNVEIYLPMKDRGIDFIGVHNNKSIQIQVKTSTFQKEKYYWFDLYGHNMVYSKNTFYIFVLYILPRRKMMGKSKNYLIIPSLDIQSYISKGIFVPKQNNENCFNVFIYPNEKDKTWIYKNKGKSIDLTKYWNNFNLINEILE